MPPNKLSIAVMIVLDIRNVIVVVIVMVVVMVVQVISNIVGSSESGLLGGRPCEVQSSAVQPWWQET